MLVKKLKIQIFSQFFFLTKINCSIRWNKNAAIDGDIPVAIFSLEMAKEQFVMRLLCAESGINSDRLRDGFFSNQDWDRLRTA
jgi:replicative DNA helicase